MTIYVILRQAECLCDNHHVVSVTTDRDNAQYIADVIGDEYAPCIIESHDTDMITRDSMLKYQVYRNKGSLFATYVGDEDMDDYDSDPEFKSIIIYARNHKEALTLARKQWGDI